MHAAAIPAAGCSSRTCHLRRQLALPCPPTPQELEGARRLPQGVQMLGEEDMGRLAAAARAAGVEPLFLTALKLAPR